MLGVLGLQWLLVSLTLSFLVEDGTASRLAHDADQLVAHLRLTDGVFTLAGARVDPIYRQPWSGHYFQVTAGEQVLRSRSLWDQALTVPGAGVGEWRLLHLPGPDHRPLLVLVQGYRKQGRTFSLALAEDFSTATRILQTLRWLYGGVSLGALLLLLVLLRHQLHRSLAPLAAARAEVEALERGACDRLNTEAVPEEVRPFIVAINRLFEVMIKRLHRSRAAAGNLSHAIKTPLALLARLEEDPALAAHPDLRGRLRDQVEAIRRLTGRELGLSCLSGGRGSGTWLEVDTEASALLRVMEQVHGRRALTLEGSIPRRLAVNLDREDLLTLLGNLLDNACRFATRRVSLTMTLDPTGLRLTVADDGPGIPPEQRPLMLQRGVRGDAPGAGHGLGLAIAETIAQDHEGRLLLERSARLGGLEVTAWLPASRGRLPQD